MLNDYFLLIHDFVKGAADVGELAALCLLCPFSIRSRSAARTRHVDAIRNPVKSSRLIMRRIGDFRYSPIPAKLIDAVGLFQNSELAKIVVDECLVTRSATVNRGRDGHC